jgi:hypothetical protein
MAVAVVTPVVFCAKATEKCNENTKTSVLLRTILLITLCCITIVVHVPLIAAWPEAELYRVRSPNHFGPMDPGILGIAGKLLSLRERFSHCTEAKT